MDVVKSAKEILSILNENGYAAYIVGGYVRDALCGVNSYDIDITTSAHPSDIEKLFTTRDNGSKYASIVVERNGFEFEITTFRRDISYMDYRHPEIEYVDSVEDDIKRRDYTVNALLMDRDLNVIDIISGLDDIKSKTIRMIGDANKRYNEDALRILRGIYLISRLGFQLSPEVYDAMRLNSHLLNYVSGYKKRCEISKIIKYNKDNSALRALVDTSASRYIGNLADGIEYLIKSDNVVNDDMLFYSICFTVRGEIDKTFEFDREYRKRIENIVKISSKEITGFNVLGYNIDDIRYANELRRILYEEYIEDIDSWYSALPIKSIGDLEINPNDLKEFANGDQIKDILNKVAKAILDGKIENKGNGILSFIRNEDLNNG